MALSDVDIRACLKKKLIRIEPLHPSQIGPASVDLTLSDEWYSFKKRLMGKPVDLSRTPFTEAFHMKRASCKTLAPGELCLGKTVEKITLPPGIIGKLEGRSRYARMGLIIHITAALVHPGSSNHQVLEIVNLAPFPVVLRSGMRISQILFEEMRTPTARPYAKFGQIARRQ
ncbi:MAG: dCTP deaminase [Elusimicrobia bacterium GWA2_69_24]|nr:MAG: dCTP deaminase [Elusimicrobia bacterium GWA2_69_24]